MYDRNNNQAGPKKLVNDTSQPKPRVAAGTLATHNVASDVFLLVLAVGVAIFVVGGGAVVAAA